MKTLNMFFYLTFCVIATAQPNETRDTQFIDKYGAIIIIDGNLKLTKPIDREFLIANVNSKLMQPNLDSLTQYRILEIAKTRRDTYRVKIAYLFFNSEKRMINYRNTYYRLIVKKYKSRYLLHEFQYEEMEF
jgi:hypothetical protein